MDTSQGSGAPDPRKADTRLVTAGRDLHIGLENVDDLKADLERGFAVFNAV